MEDHITFTCYSSSVIESFIGNEVVVGLIPTCSSKAFCLRLMKLASAEPPIQAPTVAVELTIDGDGQLIKSAN